MGHGPTRSPMIEWTRGYDRTTLSSDLTAAIIVTVMLIPQSLAYAALAGLPPQVGLYASIAPLLLYAVFGSSRVLAVGPVAAVVDEAVPAGSEHERGDVQVGVVGGRLPRLDSQDQIVIAPSGTQHGRSIVSECLQTRQAFARGRVEARILPEERIQGGARRELPHVRLPVGTTGCARQARHEQRRVDLLAAVAPVEHAAVGPCLVEREVARLPQVRVGE